MEHEGVGGGDVPVALDGELGGGRGERGGGWGLGFGVWNGRLTCIAALTQKLTLHLRAKYFSIRS